MPKVKNWYWYPYNKPESDGVYLCSAGRKTYALLRWSSRLSGWINQNDSEYSLAPLNLINFNGMYAKVEDNDISTLKHSLERVIELINERNKLAKFLCDKCDGFIQNMPVSPYILPYSALYTLCKEYEKETHVPIILSPHV